MTTDDVLTGAQLKMCGEKAEGMPEPFRSVILALLKHIKAREKAALYADHVWVHKKAHPTEVMAAQMVLPRSGTQRAKVLAAFKEAHPEPLTDDDIVQKVGIVIQSANPRRRELVSGGWLADSGVKKLNARGQQCIAWKLCDAEAVPDDL